ncbi:DUF885 family protein [Cytophagaceae bacterium DM2B3-1]|uniref:DUF885 family protein n=1 Tax=Xanthocytophaga flava TaxID=3048013 RepID=A0ABT7CWG9_9BACT|nr:DUF885 family protein [Xanthocytophaga flavus]MDJ1472160.1 DUF885 family protein [Xanthocytophaga flavus]MDJ1496944.1 DUF885 family protein [Xanthocytophaga flavus]
MQLFLLRISSFLILLCFLISPQVRAQGTNSSAEVEALITVYREDLGSLNRTYTITCSPERVSRLQQFHQQTLQKLEALDFDKLSQSGKVDYIIFKRDLKQELDDLKTLEKDLVTLQPVFAFRDKILTFEKSRHKGEVLNPKETASLINSLKTDIQNTQKEIEKSAKLTSRLNRMASSLAENLQRRFQESYHFYEGYDPLFTWWVSKPFTDADSVLSNYVGFLSKRLSADNQAKDDGSGIIGNPIGREKLIEQLRFEMIPYTPDELVTIANREFAWCETEMKKASREMGFGDDWKKALEKVKNTYVEPGKQPELIYALAVEAIDFVEKNQLVTVPELAKETWHMRMMSPQRQLVSPFFLGGEDILISYPTNTMTHEAKLMSMRGNNPHFSRATVQHELIPGHHLQGFMNDRYRPYRSMFYTPFWIEGWSLYWEMLLWDKKFPRNAEDRVGMLFWRMHRCARIIFSLSYHLEKMTPQQCIDFLVDRVGHERANAEGEVRRSFTGGYGPLYQLAYMIGGLQFRALHKELVDSGKMTDKEFHDAILKENTLPVELVRAILTKQPLTKNFQTSWRFD